VVGASYMQIKIEFPLFVVKNEGLEIGNVVEIV
jgi:hypothetical protein